MLYLNVYANSGSGGARSTGGSNMRDGRAQSQGAPRDAGRTLGVGEVRLRDGRVSQGGGGQRAQRNRMRALRDARRNR
jgi:hypothetical protein